MVFLGYGSLNDNYWLTECDDVTKNRLSGRSSGRLPDGREVSGKVVLERVDDDHFEVHLKLKSGDDEITDIGKFKRALNSEGKGE